ncbi:DNA-binding domain-containing protein [Paraburkholderia sp. J12]|uniref:DNA-binding domain-containing protein n=1 Tax=Paraburkholderia sp. J12 TaxID=2805432 RepID=UPI002ABE5C6D|nr:DNA-binding domain-containing protein [Paraburkholderia sp. J12]
MTHPRPARLPTTRPDHAARYAGFGAGSLRECQRRFAAALLDPALPVPPGLVGPDGGPVTKRFDVYRNNVVVGLVDALKAAFPATCRIVGEAFFVAMARSYVVFELPATPVMLEYGATFAAFIETFEPARAVPYLADVARLERAWAEAYHAPEGQPIDPAQLVSIDPQSLPRVCFGLHPSVRIVRSVWPVVQLWAMNIDGGEPRAIDLDGDDEDALVIRPVAEVEVRVVAAGAATFILGLMAGASVAEAAVQTFDNHPAFDLGAALRDLLAVQAIVDWSVREEVEAAPIERQP